MTPDIEQLKKDLRIAATGISSTTAHSSIFDAEAWKKAYMVSGTGLSQKEYADRFAATATVATRRRMYTKEELLKEFFGGIPLEIAQATLKEHHPEYFI